MAFPVDPEWRLNIASSETGIVYPLANGGKVIYRKTLVKPDASQNTASTTSKIAVVEVTIGKNGGSHKRILSDQEMSVAQFNALKQISDEIYRSEVKAFLTDHRRTVANLEALVNNLVIARYDPYNSAGLDSELYGDEDTVDAALIIKEAKLTEKQLIRAKLYASGKTTREIATIERCSQTSVVRSLSLARKKLKKIYEKFSEKGRSKAPFSDKG